MTTETITTPSGMVGVVRNIKAKEMSILADAKGHKKKDTHPLDAVFAGCWLETIDPGPYGEYGVKAGTTPIPWGKILMGDRFWTFLRVRACTWGDGYEYRVRCRSADCVGNRKPFVWEIPLSKLAFKELPAASRAKVAKKDLTFDITVGGKAAKFKLLTGDDEKNLGKVDDDIESHKALLAQAASRLISVDGVLPDDLIDWIGELDWPGLTATSKQFDEVDGGVETRTTIVCPHCELEWQSDIPFDVESFLLRKT